MKKILIGLLGIIGIVTITTGVWQWRMKQIDLATLGASSGYCHLDAATHAVLMSEVPASSTLRAYMGVVSQLQPDWNEASTTLFDYVKNKPSLASVATNGLYSSLTGQPTFSAVATSGLYADLTGKPAIPNAQVNSDFSTTTTSSLAYILNKPQYYRNGVRKNFWIDYSATTTMTASGTAIFAITDDGTPTGNAVCTNIFFETIYPSVPDASNNYTFGNYLFAGNKKSLTITANKLGFTSGSALIDLLSHALTVLTGQTYTPVSVGTVVSVHFICE